MKNIKIFACNEAMEFAEKVCLDLDLPLGKMNAFKFKNDNNFVQILESVRDQDIYLFQVMTPPVNERIMELLITIDAIKRASAAKITAVLPYYPYARSDKKDQPRIPVTAKLIQQLLESAGCHRVLTCDLHNPAIQSYFNIQCTQLTGKILLQDYFKNKNLEDMVVVATDAGSSKKAYKYAEYFNCKIALLDKRRDGNNDKAIATHFIGEVKGKNAVIFDDEIDTAGTMIEAINALSEHGAKEIYAGCTHGVLSSDAIERLEKSPLKELVITSTIPLKNKQSKKIKVLNIEPLFAKAILRLHKGMPLTDLF